METCTDKAFKISQEIIDSVIPGFRPQGDLTQMKSSMAPIISNAMYARENELIQNERMETFVALARVLDNESIEKAVKALRYQITLIKK